MPTEEKESESTCRRARTKAHCLAARALGARVSAFSKSLAEHRPRLRSLVAQPTSEATAALAEQHEELLVAEEELRAQVKILFETSAAAERAGNRYRDVFGQVPIACLLVDRSAVVHDANEAAENLLGASARRLRGRSLATLTTVADGAQLRMLLRSVDRKMDGPRRAEWMLGRVRGASFRAIVRIGRIDGGNRLLVTIEPCVPSMPAVVETSDLAALQRALLDKQELLARERALRADLERREATKDRFIAILSHDLRGPIQSILGWTQLMSKETLTKDGRDRGLETIARSARIQLALVEELLDVSRITSQKLSLEIAPLDLCACARFVVESQLPMALDARLSLEGDFPPEAVMVFADRRRIVQVVTNLVANAIKFTPPGGRIVVHVRKDGPDAVLVVRDDGRGMTAESIPHLFECFRQGSASPSGRAGLGLGLFIVRELVQLHGGTVEGHSDGEDRGSTFTVTLPLRESPPAPESERVLPAAESSTDLGGLHVLVVEDEHDTRELIGTILSAKGVNVSSAADAEEALALFESRAPDVVVSDIELPGDDGHALLRRVRDLGGRVPAIAVSGYAGARDKARATASGFDVHLSKPIDPRELIKRIGAVSMRRRR